jgi:hypothetical protein
MSAQYGQGDHPMDKRLIWFIPILASFVLFFSILIIILNRGATATGIGKTTRTKEAYTSSGTKSKESIKFPGKRFDVFKPDGQQEGKIEIEHDKHGAGEKNLI